MKRVSDGIELEEKLIIMQIAIKGIQVEMLSTNIRELSIH